MPVPKKSTFEPDGLANNLLISNIPFKALMLEHAVLIWLNISTLNKGYYFRVEGIKKLHQ